MCDNPGDKPQNGSVDKSKKDDRKSWENVDNGVFPKDVFPEDVFPEDVFPSDIFPR